MSENEGWQEYKKLVISELERNDDNIQKVLEGKAEGYRKMVESCGGNASAAANMLLIEKMAEMIALQVEAVKNIKVDKFTVVDSGNGHALPNAVSSLVGVVPGLHELAANVGVDLPEFFGKAVDMGTLGNVSDKGNSPTV